MSVRAEQAQRAEVLSKRAGGLSILAAVGAAVKRASLAVWGAIDRVLLTPSPKAAARHGLEMWARAEHVPSPEAHSYESRRGVSRS